ncbi:MAG: cysteine--tRNA ligase [Thermoleophilaceae bacterium]|nr:cysteine--tRNA ligase [Thermoleophilaceae bacterium]
MTDTRELKLHNTLTRELEVFQPRQPGRVAIYACGPTVYSRIHIGNARPFVLFSLYKRFLEQLGYDVTFVANVTDVNDKIYTAAAAAGIPSDQLAREMTQAYFDDTAALGLGRPDHEPLATETIGPIVNLIEALIERGHAYAAGGDVYFSVPSYQQYGELSNRDPDSMDQGEDDDSLKRDARDFALWKAHKPGEDTFWPSPWGDGRPGWHIECSAMAEHLLGTNFDIHGGGVDLVFPHHENEAAQTCAGRGEPLARYWMHNGMIRFTGEKMSKSLGNILLLHEATEAHGAPTLIMFLLSGHYRAPVECSDATLAQAASNVERLREFARRLGDDLPEAPDFDAVFDRILDALADDFNTPMAMAALFEWVRDANRRIDAGEQLGLGRLPQILHILGLETVLEATATVADAAALALLEERETARLARDFAAADRLRDELLALGWAIRDTPQGPELTAAG